MIPIIGAAITVGSCMIAGLRLHQFGEQYAPGLLPRSSDWAVLAGMVVGLVVVARWLT